MKEQLQVIMDLMKDLQDKMEYGEDDFKSRLGREDKPDIAAVKIEAKPIGAMADIGSDDTEAMDDAEDDDDSDEMFKSAMEESPEEKFKSRLMKLRG